MPHQVSQLRNIKPMLKLLAAVCLGCMLLTWLPGNAFVLLKKLPAKARIDSSNIRVKKFDAKALQHYRADKDFNYNGEAINKGESLWVRFWHWVWRVLFGWVADARYSTYLQYFLLTVSALFLAYIIFKSVGIDLVKLMTAEAKKVSVPYTETLENIHEINFDTEIENAIAQHNYRIAVRLLYLKSLKQLSDKNLIQWQIDKTNSAYVIELANPDQRQLFGLLTRRFEYVWYGNFTIDRQTFTSVNQLFQTFIKQLP